MYLSLLLLRSDVRTAAAAFLGSLIGAFIALVDTEQRWLFSSLSVSFFCFKLRLSEIESSAVDKNEVDRVYIVVIGRDWTIARQNKKNKERY